MLNAKHAINACATGFASLLPASSTMASSCHGSHHSERAVNTNKCQQWLINEEVEGTRPSNPTTDTDGCAGTSMDAFNSCDTCDDWSSILEARRSRRGYAPQSSTGHSSSRWWDAACDADKQTDKCGGYRGSSTSIATDSHGSTCSQVYPSGSAAAPAAIPRRYSLDDALDKLTATVHGSLHFSPPSRLSSLGTPCCRGGARRSLDMMLDEAESPEEDVSWMCCTHSGARRR